MARQVTPATLRRAMQIAVLDDLWHGQPELEHRDLNRENPDGSIAKVYEVRGIINPDRLGTFGAQQIERVIENTRPGAFNTLAGAGPASITVDELHALLDEVGLPGDPYHAEQAQAIHNLIAERSTYAPDFDDL